MKTELNVVLMCQAFDWNLDLNTQTEQDAATCDEAEHKEGQLVQTYACAHRQ